MKLLFLKVFWVSVFVFGANVVSAQVVPAVVISNEIARDTGYGSVVVTWDTNVSGSSRVVYDTASHGPDASLYKWSTPEAPVLGTLHGEIVSGLASGTYYMRPVSKLGSSIVLGKEIVIALKSSVGVVLGASIVTPDSYVASSATALDTKPMSPEPMLPSCENPLVGYFFIDSESNRPKEVRKLQTFLRDKEGHMDVIESGIYDSQTIEAVKVFQKKYAEEILAPWGITEPTGHVFRTTRKKINEIMCPGGNFAAFEEEQVKLAIAIDDEKPAAPIFYGGSDDDSGSGSVADDDGNEAGSILGATKETDMKDILAMTYKKSVYDGIVGPLFAMSHQVWSLFSTVTVFVLFVLGIIAVLVLRRN